MAASPGLSGKIFPCNFLLFLISFIISQISSEVNRIHLNYRPLLRLSMDLKVIPRSCRGHRYILCIIDEVTNYMITTPIKQCRLEEVGEALINDVFSKYCIPDYMIMDLDSAFMSLLMNYLFKRLGIKIKTVAPYNHQSLQAEHSIKSLSNILTKHLTRLGEMWPDYLPFATLAHNTYNSQNLSNCSPYKLVFGRNQCYFRFRNRPRYKSISNI